MSLMLDKFDHALDPCRDPRHVVLVEVVQPVGLLAAFDVDQPEQIGALPVDDDGRTKDPAEAVHRIERGAPCSVD